MSIQSNLRYTSHKYSRVLEYFAHKLARRDENARHAELARGTEKRRDAGRSEMRADTLSHHTNHGSRHVSNGHIATIVDRVIRLSLGTFSSRRGGAGTASGAVDGVVAQRRGRRCQRQ